MRLPQLALSCSVLILTSLSGCTLPTIPREELPRYALLVPEDTFRNGAAITRVETNQKRADLQLSTEGDNILPGSVTRPGVNVLPGRHTVQVTVCRSGNTASCHADSYVFDASAGKAYVLRGEDQRIVVIDRFSKKPLGYLHPAGGAEFISAEQLANAKHREMQADLNVRLATADKRQRDLSAVRKIGARVCKDYDRGIVHFGYVESMTNEKIRINISGAFYKASPELSPKGFKSSTIWDSPMNWELCE